MHAAQLLCRLARVLPFPHAYMRVPGRGFQSVCECCYAMHVAACSWHAEAMSQPAAPLTPLALHTTHTQTSLHPQVKL